MRKQKVIALFMSVIIMAASMSGLTVQADSLGKEAQACKELGILIGEDASGVTTAYLAKTPTRLQAYIISLRLKGLYDEAGEYESSRNFTDASKAGWAENFLAYARNNPELGWGGYPDGSFGVVDKINGQAFYKVMLETLGYRQGTDFEYAEALEYAEELGLVKNADTIAGKKSFTVNDIATGIYNALNTKPADSENNLIDVMVEKGIIASGRAAAAGFTLASEEVAVVGFKAISNSKLQVEFEKDIQLEKADVEVAVLGGKSRLSVLSVESHGKLAYITTTAAQPFNAYEITINTLVPTDGMAVRGYTNKFVAMPEDRTKPTVKHELLGKNEILLTFSEIMDKASAEDISNYSFDEYDVDVLSADLSDSGEQVTLRTTALSARYYGLTVVNVRDAAGNSMDRYRTPIDGARGDSDEPEVTAVKSLNDTTITVDFNKRVTEASAEDTDNYNVDELSITDAKLDETGKRVTLTTSSQKSGAGYKLTVSGVEDSWGNRIYKKTFGFRPDGSNPSAEILVISGSEVLVRFTKQMDKASAADPDNYSISEGLEVKDAFIDDTCKEVTLITSAQTARKLYTLTVNDVYDAWGNRISTTTGKFGGMSADSSALSYTAKSNGNEIILTFNKRVDSKTAQDVFNYQLDEALGYAARAALDNTGRVVTLLTAGHSSGRIYSITVSNVEDMYGNEISTSPSVCTKKFAGISSGSSGASNGTLNLETVIPVNVNTIDLVFSDELTEEELDDLEAEVDAAGSNDDLPSDIEYYKYFIDGKRNVRLQFRTDGSKNPKVFQWGSTYEVEVLEIERLNTKEDANVKSFAGSNNPNDPPEVLRVEAINSTAVEVYFSEPVKGITKSQFDIRSGVTISGVSVSGADEITEKAIVYMSTSTRLKDQEYKLYIRSGVTDAAGINPVQLDSGVSDNYIVFDGNSDDNEPPYIDSDIKILDSYTIQFSFTEEIKDISTGSFSIKKLSGSSGTKQIITKAILADDKKTVTLYMNANDTGLDPDFTYELSLNTSIRDLQDMGVATDDRKVEFEGEDIEIDKLEIISSYIDEDNRVITLITNRELNISTLSMDAFKLEGAGYKSSTSDKVEYDKKSITITLRNELSNDEELIIEITSAGRGRIKDFNNQALSTDEVEIDTN